MSTGPDVARLDHIAHAQAQELHRQAERIRELIRERDKARDDRQAALDLAEQYARKAGVDVSRDEALGYVTAYWEQLHRMDARRHVLEGQQWEVLQLALQLDELVEGKRSTDMDALALARKVAQALTQLMSAQLNKTRRAPELFARPTAPGIDALERVR